MSFNRTFVFLVVLCALAAAAPFSSASARTEMPPTISFSFSPAAGTFSEGSSFDVSVLVDTHATSINTIDLIIQYDPRKVLITNPAGSKSIIGAWSAPPTYDNTQGVMHISGLIPKGIAAESGLVATITFKAVATGDTAITIGKESQVLANDGIGTSLSIESSRGVFTIIPRVSGGIDVFSNTHPLQSTWYNNNSPAFSWQKSAGVEGFSTAFDTDPFTNPPNVVSQTGTNQMYADQGDGERYFHIKALKNGAWSAPTHYRVRIDTTPPLPFTPVSNTLLAAIISRSLISFEAKDTLSGVDHYEVGVIDKADTTTKSPVFVESASPYQLPLTEISKALVIVRAFDAAGNVREVSLEVTRPFIIRKLLGDYAVQILLVLLLVTLFVFIAHYFVGHHIIRHAKTVWAYVKKAEAEEKKTTLTPPAPTPPSVPPKL